MKKHVQKIQTRYSHSKEHVRVHQQLIVLLLAAIIFLSMGTVYFVLSSVKPANPERLVTFYDQGAEHTVLTRATTVRGALRAAAIAVDSHDMTDPTIESRLDKTHVDVIIYRSRPVNIIDGGTRQTVMTVAQSPNELLQQAKLEPLGVKDKTTFGFSDTETQKVATLTIERSLPEPPPKPVFAPLPNALTKAKGAQIFIDSSGVAHRETYYDLPMNIVIRACGAGGFYTIRSDGAKIDQDGYVLVAAGFSAYPRCTVVETSMGPGKVYDTGGFALRHPYGFDLATDWTNYDGQ